MPIYEYKCTNGHQFEVMQRMSEDALTACEVCDATVQRVFHPVAVHFKGSGFYNTDYGTRRRSREAAEAGDSKNSDGGSKSGSQTDSTKSDSAKSDSGKSKSDSDKSGSSTAAAAAAD
jgi:putative FmdB family regulatory protein